MDYAIVVGIPLVLFAAFLAYRLKKSKDSSNDAPRPGGGGAKDNGMNHVDKS